MVDGALYDVLCDEDRSVGATYDIKTPLHNNYTATKTWCQTVGPLQDDLIETDILMFIRYTTITGRKWSGRESLRIVLLKVTAIIPAR